MGGGDGVEGGARGDEEGPESKALAYAHPEAVREGGKERVTGLPGRRNDGSQVQQGRKGLQAALPGASGLLGVQHHGRHGRGREHDGVEGLLGLREQQHGGLGGVDQARGPDPPLRDALRRPREVPCDDEAAEARAEDGVGGVHVAHGVVPAEQDDLGRAEGQRVEDQDNGREPGRAAGDEQARQEDGGACVEEQDPDRGLDGPVGAPRDVEEPEVVPDEPDAREAHPGQEERELLEGAGAVVEDHPEGADQRGRDDGEREPHGQAGGSARQHEGRGGRGEDRGALEGPAEVQEDRGPVPVDRGRDEDPVPGRVEQDVLAEGGKDHAALHPGHERRQGDHRHGPAEGVRRGLLHREPPEAPGRRADHQERGRHQEQEPPDVLHVAQQHVPVDGSVHRPREVDGHGSPARRLQASLHRRQQQRPRGDAVQHQRRRRWC